MNIQGISAVNFNNNKQQNFKARIIKGIEINHYGKDVFDFIPEGWCNLNELGNRLYEYSINAWLYDSRLIKDTLKLEHKDGYAEDLFILNSKEVKRAGKYLKTIISSIEYTTNDELDKAAKETGFIDYLANIRKHARTVQHRKIGDVHEFNEAFKDSIAEQTRLYAKALEAKKKELFR